MICAFFYALYIKYRETKKPSDLDGFVTPTGFKPVTF